MMNWYDRYPVLADSIFLKRDVVREWRGAAPSKYPGRFIRFLSDESRIPLAFNGGSWMRLYLKLLLLPFDVACRIFDLVRWRFWGLRPL